MKLQFTGAAISIDAAESTEPRITGIAVPYNVTASVSTGQTVKLLAGSMPASGRMPRLVLEHDTTRVVGVVDQRQDTPDGMLFSARIADTAEGRDLVALLKMGALDSVSVGIQATEFEYEGSVLVVKAAMWDELSVVYEPAFQGAQITQVAASQAEDDSDTEADEPQPDNIPQEETMSEQTPAVEASAEIVPTTPIYAAARREFRLPSASEYISAFIRGGADFAQLNENIRAAAPDVVTTDLPGVLPTPVVSTVFNSFRGLRPVIDSVGARQLPAGGKVFIRPVVTTHTTIGEAVAEQSPSSGTFVVDDIQFTKEIFGGYVEVSEASLDWSQPEVLSAMLDDMARIYANATDNYAADLLVSGTTNTNNFTAANIADPVEWVTWFYTAASDILTGSNGNLPSTVWMAPNRWASAGSLSDTADRPLFPNVGPMNAFGSTGGVSDSMMNMFGCRVVVDRNLAAGTLLIGDPSGFEYYEQQKGAISIEQPSSLSRQIAFRGYASAKVIDANMFIKAAFV